MTPTLHGAPITATGLDALSDLALDDDLAGVAAGGLSMTSLALEGLMLGLALVTIALS